MAIIGCRRKKKRKKEKNQTYSVSKNLRFTFLSAPDSMKMSIATYKLNKSQKRIFDEEQSDQSKD